jgi:Protein of unknown function (DUF2844)
MRGTQIASFRWLLKILFAVAILPGLAFATLGQNVSSVQSDQAHMKASVRVVQRNAYVLHQMQTPSGTVVREYASPAGVVFGVAWQGASVPDLRQLLGTYFNPYVQAMQKRSGHGPRLIEEPGLVMQVSGHQRAFSGKVYVPAMVPSGVPAEQIQ